MNQKDPDKHRKDMEWLGEELGVMRGRGARGEDIYLSPFLEIHIGESTLDGSFSARALRIIADEMDKLEDERS